MIFHHVLLLLTTVVYSIRIRVFSYTLPELLYCHVYVYVLPGRTLRGCCKSAMAPWLVWLFVISHTVTSVAHSSAPVRNAIATCPSVRPSVCLSTYQPAAVALDGRSPRLVVYT